MFGVIQLFSEYNSLALVLLNLIGVTMKIMNAVFALFTNLFFTTHAMANEDCIKGLTKIDMCAKAREFSNEFAKQLPMQMNKNMTWESVSSLNTTIQGVIRFSYDRKFLGEKYKQAGIPISAGKQAMQKSASNLCQEGSPTRAFIELGGTFRYIYLFIDGEQFTEVDVSSCN